MTTPGRSSIGVRVRPNANDFIKDLERQLAGKRKTFHVDVHANLKPANAQIKAWARSTLKAMPAVLNVGANMAPANKDVAAWRAKQRTIKTNIPIGADLSKAYTEVLTFRKIAGKPISVELKVNTESANRAADRFSAAMARRGVSVPLDVEPGSIARTANKIDTDLVRRLKAQGGVVLGVDADTKAAEATLASFAAKSPKVESQLDLDTKQARLELTKLRAEALRRKLEVKVDVKRGALDNFSRGLDSIEKRLGNFNFVRSLDFGPINLGKPGGLVGTLTTVTALAGAMPLAVTAATSLSKAIMDLAGAASIAPGAIGGLLASIATFQIGVSGVGEAISALTDMWTEGSASQASTARRSVQAHNQLRQAVREEASAQREVGSARREATNDLRNLNNELRGSVLNEAQAILDLQKARDRLAQGGFENMTDFKQAQLDEAKANQSLIEVRERNGQLQQKVNDENAKGVEGSDKVQSALERQTRASEQAAMALEAISSTQATGALGKFQDEIDQLTPNARDFVMVLFGMRGEFMDLRNMLQEDMFAGAAPAFQTFLDKMMPVAGPGMKRIAAAMNASLLQVFDTLGGDQGQSIIERILGGTAGMWESISKLIDPAVRGLGTLMAAGAEHLPQVVDLFTRLADRFANFIEAADRSGALDKFMDRGVDALGKMAELGINLLEIVYNLGEAFSGDLLQGLVDVTQKFADWIKSAEGQKQINEWIEQGRQLWEDWRPVLEDLPGIFGAVGEAARGLIGIVTPFLNLFTSVMEKAPGLVEAFVGVWLGSKLITGFLSPVSSLLGGIIKGFKFLTGFTPPAWMAKLPGMGGLPGSPVAAAGAGGLAGAAGIATSGLMASVLSYQAVSQQEAADQQTKDSITEAAKALPPGIPAPETIEAQHAVTGGAAAGIPGFKWIAEAPVGAGNEGRAEWAKRYIWVMTQPDPLSPNLKPPEVGSYESGGYTNWPRQTGNLAMLHGREYIQPADTTAHYGVSAMRAIHQKRVPKELLQSFEGGGYNLPGYDSNNPTGGGNFNPNIEIDTSRTTVTKGYPNVNPDTLGYGLLGHLGGMAYKPPPGSYMPPGEKQGRWGPFRRPDPGPAYGDRAFAGFEVGGYNDPNDPRYRNPEPGMLTSLVQHGMAGLSNVSIPQVPGGAVGPAPGPVGPIGAVAPPTPSTDIGPMASTGGLNIMGFQFPGTGGHAPVGPGWGPGGPPIGLGGGPAGPNGEAPFDMRTLGIGPGPAGSGPTDWMNKVNEIGGEFFSGLIGETLKGTLGFFGLEGVLSSPYFGAATGLGTHFANPGGSSGKSSVQGAGAGATNTAVDEALATYYGMPTNPAMGAPGGMPQVFDPAGNLLPNAGSKGGEGGLQIKTIAIKRMVEKMFPGIKSIGGYRKDALQWHPSGRALDVMVSNLGNNDATPADAKALGDAIYAWAVGPAGQAMGVYPAGTLWQQKDHYNHVHIALLDGGGYPSGSGPSTQDSTGVAAGPKDSGGWAPFTQGGGKPPPKPAAAPSNGPLQDLLKGAGPNAQAGDPFKIPVLTRDRGGVLPRGTSIVNNFTGSEELVLNKDQIKGFAVGGYNNGFFNTGVVPPRLPLPPPVQAQVKQPRPAPPPPPANIGVQQPPTVPPPAPAPPPPSIGPPMAQPPGVGAVPTTPTVPGVGVQTPASTVTPAQIGTGAGPGAGQKHLHPAISKGIQSGAATIGKLGDMAVAAATMGATMGMGGAAAGAAGGAGGLGGLGGGGGMGGGLSVSGMVAQGGKIVEGLANVGASFLVGNVTNGTTENPYGVTQRASNPTGGTTRITDNSQKYGDVYTQNPDEFFRKLDLRDAQKSQGSLGGYDRYA